MMNKKGRIIQTLIYLALGIWFVHIAMEELPGVVKVLVVFMGAWFITSTLAVSGIASLNDKYLQISAEEIVEEHGLISLEETAELCGVTPRIIEAEVTTQRIAFYKFGDKLYFKGEDIMAYRERAEKVKRG